MATGTERAWRWVLIAAVALLPPLGAWVLLHGTYQSWHPCDWLLVDRVALILRREGIDPDTASIPLKAMVVESGEAQAVIQLRHTPMQCLLTWVSSRVLP